MSKLILSLDGGGIRGAAITQFLMKIETELQLKYKKSIRDYVDFYAGTSTGSIIALALATTKITMANINELYNYDNAKEIFKENKGWFEIDGINAPKYEAKGKTTMLKKSLGEKTKIGDVPKDKHVLAVTYGIEKREPEVIKSTDKDHRLLLSYNVADASSAAPTYFPTKELAITEEDYWLIDGGITANNPTMCAISEALKIWKLPLSELKVLSIGTGYRTRKINGPESQKWGAMQWMTKGHLIDLLSDEKVVEYQARTISAPGNYIRVNASLKPHLPELPHAPDDAMDDVSRKNIMRLKEFGDFWFLKYGAAVVEFLAGSYKGKSLDRIDHLTRKPIER